MLGRLRSKLDLGVGFVSGFCWRPCPSCFRIVGEGLVVCLRRCDEDKPPLGIVLGHGDEDGQLLDRPSVFRLFVTQADDGATHLLCNRGSLIFDNGRRGRAAVGEIVKRPGDFGIIWPQRL